LNTGTENSILQRALKTIHTVLFRFQGNPKENNIFWVKSPEKHYNYRFVFTKGVEAHGNRYILRMYEIELLEKGHSGKTSEIDSSHFDWYEKRSAELNGYFHPPQMPDMFWERDADPTPAQGWSV